MEPVSRNLWDLLQRDFNMAQLVAAVDVLGEAGWTSLPAEQQHASLAMLHKWHPDYETKTLVSRSLMVQMSKLLPAASKEEKEAQRLSAKLDRILRANPQKINGRHMLAGAMIAICSGKKDAGRPGYEASMSKIARHCFTRHTAMWAQQTLAQQNEWHHRAQQHSGARAHLLQLEWQVLSAELAKVEEKVVESKQTSSPMTMRSAALSEADVDMFARLWNQPGFRSPEHMAFARAGVATAPRHFGSEDTGIAVWERTEPTMPDWSTPLVVDRQFFNGTALVILRANGDREFWKLVFAIKNPKFYLGVCRLHPITPSPFDLAAEPLPLDPPYIFNMNYADCRSAAEVNIGAGDTYKILLRLLHTGGTRVTSDMEPLDLDYIQSAEGCDMGKVDDAEPRAKAAPKQDVVFEKLVQALPWLQHFG